MGLKCTKANKTIPVQPTPASGPRLEENSQSHKADDYSTVKKERPYAMVDHSMMGDTIDREANNETALKREGVEEDAEFEVYMPRQQVSALLRLERPMMYVCSGEPIKYKI